MEEMLQSSEASREANFELQLNQSAKGFLKETTKWAYFLSILGFVFVVIMMGFAVFAGTFFGSFNRIMPGQIGGFGNGLGYIMAFFYMLMAVLYFFPVYYLYKFATNAKIALANNDSESLTTSFSYLKSHYKFIAIMMISILCLYGMIAVLGVIAVMAR